MGASQCKVWYLNCGTQGHAVWVADIEGQPIRIFVDGEVVFQGPHESIPEHGEVLRQVLEGKALVVNMEKTSNRVLYKLEWDGQQYEDDLSMLRDKNKMKSAVDMSDSYKVRLKAMEVKMEEAPVKEGSALTKSTAFFTIIANLYSTQRGGARSPKSPNGQVQICSGVSAHRFSALLDLHDTLAAYYAVGLPDVKMPKKPEKSVKGIGGVSTSDADFIGQRKMAIDKWLEGLVKLPRVVYLPDFVQFFGLPFIRPKYCGSHIVFAEATSLDAPAQRANEAKPKYNNDDDDADDASTAEEKEKEKENKMDARNGSGDDDGADATADTTTTTTTTADGTDAAGKGNGKGASGFETVDDFADFAEDSPSKSAVDDMEVPEAYAVSGVQEVGLSMFGEDEEEEEEEDGEKRKATGRPAAATGTGNGTREGVATNAASAGSSDQAQGAGKTDGGGGGGDGDGVGGGGGVSGDLVTGKGKATGKEAQEPQVSPTERLLQAESKLSLYQQRLEQAEESNSYGLVDKLYEEIAKLQRTVFMLKEEAAEYEAANAPTEAELWAGDEGEEDGGVEIEEMVVDDTATPASGRRNSAGDGDEWGDFAAETNDDEWGDGGDVNDADPFGTEGAGTEESATGTGAATESNQTEDPFDDDPW